MRAALITVIVSIAACSPAPRPPGFSFDVENRLRVPIIVSVASDTAATMPGFEPGQRGTISIGLKNPQNGISVEIQAPGCHLLASAMLPTPATFTLLIEDGPGAGSVRLSTVAGSSSIPIALPVNTLEGCPG
jgi:hypothetical protein